MTNHEIILEEYFFRYTDRGRQVMDTPLYRHVHHGPSLTRKISNRFQIPMDHARKALTIAFEEVKL